MKVLALDYGSARTGVAVSDETGTLARPLGVVRRLGTPQGLRELLAIVERERPALVVVGLPLTLRGERGSQAVETEAAVARLREHVGCPIELEDERFTTTIARRTPTSGRNRVEEDDPAAACVLLQGYLDRLAVRDDRAR